MMQRLSWVLVSLCVIFHMNTVEAKPQNRLTLETATRLSTSEEDALCIQLSCTPPLLTEEGEEITPEGALCDARSSHLVPCSTLLDIAASPEENHRSSLPLIPQGISENEREEDFVPWWQRAASHVQGGVKALYETSLFLSSTFNYLDFETLTIMGTFFSYAAKELGYDISPDQFIDWIYTLQEGLEHMTATLKALHEALLFLPLPEEKLAFEWWKRDTTVPEEGSQVSEIASPVSVQLDF